MPDITQIVIQFSCGSVESGIVIPPDVLPQTLEYLSGRIDMSRLVELLTEATKTLGKRMNPAFLEQIQRIDLACFPRT